MTRRRSGFTLVETMVAGTIFLSMSLIATLWLTGVSDVWWTTNTQSHVRQQAHQAVARMADELRLATRTAAASPPNLAVPAVPNNTSMTFYLPADTNDANTTIVDAIGEIEWPNPAVPIQYVYVPASRQVQRVQGGQITILATDVQAARFDDVTTDPTLSLDEVRISLTVQRVTPQQRTVTATSTEIIRARN
ncbi:MAG: hypothetical protein COV75_08650 [Candidatus Omnitrophica bacterium CG11_big_fil_rev_8_21_14_0_20_63_9]|nr:MAG: hypothetical protein COV75_08650 [Candidatus Omnitrophica bacterium CG11_big_fil_rev_8_21_14_0_20_63_9]